MRTGLPRRKKWQAQFGLSSNEDTPSTYRPRPYSRSFVTHHDDWYAQAHPDEDFAETFAVWLTPGLDWRARYAGWKALEKLEYVDELMKSLAGQPPLVAPQFRGEEKFISERQIADVLRAETPGVCGGFPGFLRSRPASVVRGGTGRGATGTGGAISARAPANASSPLSARGPGGKKYTVNQLVRDLSQRCDKLELQGGADDPALLVQVTAYLTALVTNYLFTGKFKRTK